MSVYFIQAGEGGPVKIGHANDPIARMAEFQIGHYEQLRLLKIVNAGWATKSWLHRRFAAFHIRGEWFRFDGAMLSMEPPALIDAERPRSEALREAIQIVGVGGLAAALGITSQAVSQWDVVPLDRVIAVEAATGVDRTELRPDVFNAPHPTDSKQDSAA